MPTSLPEAPKSDDSSPKTTPLGGHAAERKISDDDEDAEGEGDLELYKQRGCNKISKKVNSRTDIDGWKINVKNDIPVHSGVVGVDELVNWIDQLKTYFSIYQYRRS